MVSSPSANRRRFRRVQAPILVRPAGLLAWAAARTVTDISLGGYPDLRRRAGPVGRRLELELLFADGRTATVLAEVAWAEALDEGAPARHEMGLHLISAGPDALRTDEGVARHQLSEAPLFQSGISAMMGIWSSRSICHRSKILPER